MLSLLQNLNCYSPRFVGVKDILICNDKILKIRPCREIIPSDIIENIIDCGGLMAFPGIIDQHVHITGGGGEQGFKSRIPEIDIREILKSGVTTVCGLLGADGTTRNLIDLFAKAKSLEAGGISSFIYSGSYSMPPLTFTDNITKDLVLIDKIIGAGEIAVSDHRSSQPLAGEIAKLASQVHLGGLLSDKAGVIHIHVGDGKGGLRPVIDAISNYDLPSEMFVPTHLNRNPELLGEALELSRAGGNTDFTAGETEGIAVPKAVKKFVDAGLSLSRVTVSSDANGSIPGGGAGKIKVIYDDLWHMINDEKLPPEKVFSLVTENVARILKLYPKKGALREGSDADILIVDKNYNVDKLFCMGILMVDGGRPV
ncbi:MAG TPA: beta-aspartyl-peptidase [Ruminiclostridium sp.]|nr:beta-aspartyl-peptidase [Ruminiclostridium sp.]